MLKLALESRATTYRGSRQPEAGGAALRDSQPALVLSDLRLPKGDGMGVLCAVKDLDTELLGHRHDGARQHPGRRRGQ